MALKTKYQAFLVNPTTDYLASNASINYVPTLTTINEAIGILKHLRAQQQVVKKKEEKILNAFENKDSLCLETDTTLQFTLGGGTYLPGLDDNFLAEKTVNVPILHIVTFDADQKILQIRLHWDQACLLKAVDTIGARGRNWPINSGKDQARVISTSAAAAPHLNPSPETTPEDGGRVGRAISRGVDPHASLSLFTNRDPNSFAREDSPRNLVEPRASAKPPPREWSELFAGEETPEIGAAERSPSPSKLDNPLKSGAGKHYKDIRVFSPEKDTAKERGIKTDARKYEHFEFGEAEFQPSPIKNDRSKHMSQWDFADFMTPAKMKQRQTASHTRNFDFDDGFGSEADAKKPLVWSQHVPQPRHDANPHFNLGDATPTDETPRAIISRTEQSKGLYHDPVFGEREDEALGTKSTEKDKTPLGNITNTNINAAARQSTFGSQWDTVERPPSTGNENISSTTSGKNVSEATKRVVKGMEAGWSLFDDSAQELPQSKGIKILGNGRGSSNAADNGLWWEN